MFYTVEEMVISAVQEPHGVMTYLFEDRDCEWQAVFVSCYSLLDCLETLKIVLPTLRNILTFDRGMIKGMFCLMIRKRLEFFYPQIGSVAVQSPQHTLKTASFRHVETFITIRYPHIEACLIILE